MVFCQVVGEEEDGHIGLKGRAKVDSQSKFNKREAEKIVSMSSLRKFSMVTQDNVIALFEAKVC